MSEKRYVWGTGPTKQPKPPEVRHVALSEFRSLGYTQQQATDLVGAARHLAAASGLTLDDAERALYRALQDFHPGQIRN
jgi:hypothetical protein